MYIIVGLGNPGREYADTRHNIGFIALDMLADKYNINVTRSKHKALIGEGLLNGERVVLAKPQTYMNLSGESLLALRNWYKVPEDKIIVIYDDIDLDTGVLRIRARGSGGSHNGMRSIIYNLASHDFPRVRIGIGKPPEKWELKDYVLSKFKEEEIEPMRDALDRALKGIEYIVKDGLDLAMSRCNF